MTIAASIAMNRFGLGTRIGQKNPDTPQLWLLEQLELYDARPVFIDSQPSRSDIARLYQKFQMDSRILRRARKNDVIDDDDIAIAEEQRRTNIQNLTANYVEAVSARLTTAVVSKTDFAERLVHFWSNHFAVSADNNQVTALAGSFEFEAIRPNILGTFKDLLGAAIAHPAMLIYLDQVQSVGPNSALARQFNRKNRKRLGLNENLAREILELHTMGVRTGYNQIDVNECARALTGMTVAGFAAAPIDGMSGGKQDGDTFFLDEIHEPGSRQIMGKRYDAGGEVQIQSIMADLATHPSTARHIATKMAQHFVADIPPPSLVAKLEQSFLKTGGDLPSLYQALVEAPEVWPNQWNVNEAKFKSPWEWVVSSLRALGSDNAPGNEITASVFAELGQPIWKPGSPAGYDDRNAAWAGSSGLMRRLEVASRLARHNGQDNDPSLLASQILPSVLSASTMENIARAESPAQGLTLLLVSPEFLRR